MRVAFVPAQIFPGNEVCVVVLPAGFEEVRVVRNQHRRHTLLAQGTADRLLPHFDGSPRTPQEVERTAQDVVSRWHAGKRPCYVPIEAKGTRGEAIEIRRLELRTPVGPEHVAIQTVEQHHDGVAGWGGRGGRSPGHRVSSRSGVHSLARDDRRIDRRAERVAGESAATVAGMTGRPVKGSQGRRIDGESGAAGVLRGQRSRRPRQRVLGAQPLAEFARALPHDFLSGVADGVGEPSRDTVSSSRRVVAAASGSVMLPKPK